MTKLMRPPRWAERLLETTGADPEFRDGIIGDMNEEFMIRASYDGPHAARRWYAREALRTLPHLLRDWKSRFGLKDAKYLGGVIIESYCVVAVSALVLLGILAGLLTAIDVDLGSDFPGNNPYLHRLGIPGALILAASCSLIGGYFAAWKGQRAPLASAAGLGVFWCSIALVGVALVRTAASVGMPSTDWWMFAEMLVVLCGTVGGGILRLATADDPTVSTR
jgi:hypothetical protein